jgi:hypothetical protein
MATIVDPDNAPGNMEELEKSLGEAVTAQDASDTTPQEVSEGSSEGAAASDPLSGSKFEGKNVQDVLASYKNLESAYGRMANDLGTQRKLTDRLLDLKREDDLERNAQPTQKVDSADLLDNPQETLDRYVSEREARIRQEYDEKLAHFESQLMQDRVLQKHPDFMDVGQNPQFLEWTQASPIRARVAVAAANGDWQAADDLLTEYKAQAGDPQQQQLPLSEGQGVAEAKKIGLESAAQGGDAGSSSKVYRRADLIQLKVEKPDIYADPTFQNEILKAYSEGRVK